MLLKKIDLYNVMNKSFKEKCQKYKKKTEKCCHLHKYYINLQTVSKKYSKSRKNSKIYVITNYYRIMQKRKENN